MLSLPLRSTHYLKQAPPTRRREVSCLAKPLKETERRQGFLQVRERSYRGAGGTGGKLDRYPRDLWNPPGMLVLNVFV